MNLLDSFGQEDMSDLQPTLPGSASRSSSSSSPTSTGAAASAERGFCRPSSFEHADPRSELGEELSRRLDGIDSKLDFLVSRAGTFAEAGRPRSLRGTADGGHRNDRQDRIAGGTAIRSKSLRSTTDGGHRHDRNACDKSEPLSPIAIRDSVRSKSRSSCGGGGHCHDRNAGCRSQPLSPRAFADAGRSSSMRSTRDGGHPFQVDPPAKSNATAPAGPGPIDMPWGRRLSSERSQTLGSQDFSDSPSTNRGHSFVSKKLFEKSKSKNLEHIADHMKSLPKALTKRRSVYIDYVYTILEDPSSSDAAWWTAKCLQVFVLLSVLGTSLQTMEDPPIHGRSAAIMETVVDAVFLSEICIRWLCAPSKVPLFFVHHFWIDVVAASALAVRAAVGFVIPESPDDPVSIYLLCFVPITRLLKMLRHFPTFQVLITAFRNTMEALPMLLYAVALNTMTFATLIYLAEPELFESPFRATWFCLVTITTVGYGDYTPVTSGGTLIVMILIMVGVILMAVPIGIIGNTFNEVWKGRDYDLLLSKTRDKLNQWGYTARDIPKLFKLVDYDESGQLELDEFVQLVKEMGIGLSEHRIVDLFWHMDDDNSGALDAKEFALKLFPHDRRLRKELQKD